MSSSRLLLFAYSGNCPLGPWKSILIFLASLGQAQFISESEVLSAYV